MFVEDCILTHQTEPNPPLVRCGCRNAALSVSFVYANAWRTVMMCVTLMQLAKVCVKLVGVALIHVKLCGLLPLRKHEGRGL